MSEGIKAARPERAEALSPGHRPGLLCAQTCRPVRAKALKFLQFAKLLPLQGAFLIAVVPRAMPWAKSFCPFRRIGYFQQHGSKIFLLLKLLELLQACKGYFLCFWSCCRLARVTFCAFGAVAGLQGLLFVLLELLQACKGHFLCFWGCCRLARVTFCAFGALAGLQGLLFVLLELLQACKGYFYKLLGLLQVTFRCKSDKKTTIPIKFYR